MLALEVDAPLHGVLELLLLEGLGVAEQVDGLRVGDPDEGVLRDEAQTLDEAHLVALVGRKLLFDVGLPLGEELQLGREALQNLGQDEAEAILGEVHVVGQVVEGHLGFDHPELGEVPGRVAVLRSERRAEGVHLAEGHGAELGLQLAADGQVGGLAEEVGRMVDGPVFRLRHLIEVQGGHLEHLPRSLGVTAGDDGGVEHVEPGLVEVLVDGILQAVAEAEDRIECAGPEAQMGLFPKELHGVSLHLDGVHLRVGVAEHFDARHVHLGRLARALTLHQDALGPDGRAGGEPLEQGFLGALAVEDKLQVAQARSVIDGEELVVAEGAHPAADGDILPDVCRVEQFGNGVSLHAGKDAAIQAGFGVLVSSAETAPSRSRTTRWA